MFSGKSILITGGTGSFGNAVVRRMLATDVEEIHIFSRDEKKQHDMRVLFNDPRLRFVLGDIRNLQSISLACKNVNYIFQAAALKQVPSCEFFPMEAMDTNVVGANNVLTAAINCGVEKVVCLSTDKAVYPINAMGISKALMEKVVGATARKSEETVITTTRYGNVMASRGSVIPLFVRQILDRQAVTITDPRMTRFMMTLEDAVELVLFAFRTGRPGDIFVKKSPAASLDILITAIEDLLNSKGHPREIIGTRHGEKLYESLLTREEMAIAEDLGEFYRIPLDERGQDYSEFFSDGQTDFSDSIDYHSHNAAQLTLEEMKEMLKRLGPLEDLQSI